MGWETSAYYWLLRPGDDDLPGRVISDLSSRGISFMHVEKDTLHDGSLRYKILIGVDRFHQGMKGKKPGPEYDRTFECTFKNELSNVAKWRKRDDLVFIKEVGYDNFLHLTADIFDHMEMQDD